MTKSRNLRLYRACQRCRRRKLKCEPVTSAEQDKDSCFECLRAREDCVLAGSQRGGDYSGFRRKKAQRQNRSPTADTPNNSLQPTATLQARSNTTPYSQGEENHDVEDTSVENPVYAELRNPRDALDMLARLAADEIGPTVEKAPYQSSPGSTFSHTLSRGDNGQATQRPWVPYSPLTDRDSANTLGLDQCASASDRLPTLSDTETLVIGVLGAETTRRLLTCYANKYHPFSPLASKSLLEPKDLSSIALEEPFLLTVILTIASKDDPIYHRIHQQCWQYLKRHLMDILFATPSTMCIGTVEGLLLLAEWVPYAQLETDYRQTKNLLLPKSFTALEDHTAWSLIGQAVRHSYLLRLDQASFESNVCHDPELENRKRLAWVFVYIADRQISVRMGQSFWSRGPSLSTRFTANDFPSLRLSTDAEHNYAKVLQATIELTQLLHNAHDILYSSRDRTIHMVRHGDYNRYLDDFCTSLSAWRKRWNGLEASPKLSCTLSIVREYVCLYVNSFSFQAVLSRAAKGGQEATKGRKKSPVPPQTQLPDVEQVQTLPQSLLPDGLMASPDGVYLFTALKAARDILNIATKADFVDHIRCMPFRFYVYTIYAAVFLFKADVFGAVARTEHEETTNLVRRFIALLDRTASNSEEHVAKRYGKLLKRMWLGDSLSPQEGFPKEQCNPGNITMEQGLVPLSSQCGMSYAGPPWDGTFDHEGLSSQSMSTMPDLTLFFPDFSALETEVLDLGVGVLGGAGFTPNGHYL